VSQFVLNEWFWHDLYGDNGDAAQHVTARVIQRLANSQHQIVIARGEAFDTKAWKLCTIRPILGKAFVLMLRQDSDRCLLLDRNALPPEPPWAMELVKPDDRYLIRTCLGVPGSTLVTSDHPLIEVVTRHGISAVLRDDFLANL